MLTYHRWPLWRAFVSLLCLFGSQRVTAAASALHRRQNTSETHNNFACRSAIHPNPVRLPACTPKEARILVVTSSGTDNRPPWSRLQCILLYQHALRLSRRLRLLHLLHHIRTLTHPQWSCPGPCRIRWYRIHFTILRRSGCFHSASHHSDRIAQSRPRRPFRRRFHDPVSKVVGRRHPLSSMSY